ncbi:serine hydrolase domain-containing protein [Muriicola sp. Z0-33]|uniref:serine hydrolase domain-containing protein n=1 Tax=Muriicola sp. Z0-33 TaxID=2816957 RepID=UPI0022386FE8|nr:serine hydrolase domain-containing protein [Muriicola sp. Z0-33]MCW5517465.1 serine hydrolase [Muriicola sp. Z0-33]
MQPKHFFILLFFFCILNTKAQLTSEQAQKIDSLFTSWTADNHPGGAVGIMQKGEIIYSKAFGLASLEYQVPNSTATIFNTGSVSKQFTAMGIVLLHLQGKLSVDDDIRKHLPDLPNFGHTITIRHMLHHTSGMRSLHAMLGLAGWRGDDSRTNEDLYRFMLQQKELNFIPGDEFLYCNTGYMLMVNIIEKVTNKDFPQWMKANIFEPLGMPNTYVEDQYNRVVLNNATSYYGAGDNFSRAVEYWGYVGSGNMHSTTSDLLSWFQNFSTPQADWEAAFQMLRTTDPLNNGSENNYAFGVNLGSLNGYEKIGHGGAIGGFRASAATYPGEELSIAILTNFSSSNPGQLENKIANILLEEKSVSTIPEAVITEELHPISMATGQLKQFEGSYWNDKENYARKIYIKNDTLRYYRSSNSENALVPIAANAFKMTGISAKLIATFKADEKGAKTMMVSVDDDTPSIFEYFDPITNTEAFLAQYPGRFYSPELESTLDINIKEDRLFAHHARHGDAPITLLKKDILEIEGMAIVKFQRQADGKITGIRVSNGRARNVWFKKQD